MLLTLMFFAAVHTQHSIVAIELCAMIGIAASSAAIALRNFGKLWLPSQGL